MATTMIFSGHAVHTITHEAQFMSAYTWSHKYVGMHARTRMHTHTHPHTPTHTHTHTCHAPTLAGILEQLPRVADVCRQSLVVVSIQLHQLSHQPLLARIICARGRPGLKQAALAEVDELGDEAQLLHKRKARV